VRACAMWGEGEPRRAGWLSLATSRRSTAAEGRWAAVCRHQGFAASADPTSRRVTGVI
jgi:hypothetical protein